MDEIHGIMRAVPPLTYAVMVGIPLAMVVAAVGFGWYAQAGSPPPGDDSRPARAQTHALGAGLTIAVVPLAFVILMLWSRFG